MVGGRVEAVNARRFTNEIVGTSDGTPGQRFTVQHGPIVRAVEEPVVEVSTAEVTGADGDTGDQVPPGAADARAAAMGRVFDHPAEATAIAERGRNRVVENWSWKRTAERTVTHYRALLDEAAAERAGSADADQPDPHHAPAGV